MIFQTQAKESAKLLMDCYEAFGLLHTDGGDFDIKMKAIDSHTNSLIKRKNELLLLAQQNESVAIDLEAYCGDDFEENLEDTIDNSSFIQACISKIGICV